MLPTKFQVNGHFSSEEEVKNRFLKLSPWRSNFKSTGLLVQEKWRIDFQYGRYGGHLEFLIGMIIAIFDLQVTLMLPIKVQVKWHFYSREEAKNGFSRWPLWNDFSYFWSTSQPDASYQVSSQLAFWFRRRSEKLTFKMVVLDFPSKKVIESPGSAKIISRSPSLTGRGRGNRQNQTSTSRTNGMKSTKISSLFPKRGNRNAKRTEKYKNKITQGKT